MQTQSTTTRPTGIVAATAALKRKGIQNEIRAMCLARGFQPTACVALALESDVAEQAVRRMLKKFPVCTRR